MTKLPCGVVEDLLPLYIDELCGEESRTLVAQHLENCPACRSKYDAMREPVAVEPAVPHPAEPEEEKARAVLKKAATHYRGVAIGWMLLAVFLCVALFTVLGGPAWMCEEIDIPAKEIELIDAQVEEDGSVRLLLGANSYHAVNGGGMLDRKDENGQTYYIVFFWAYRYSWLSPRTDGEDYAYVFDSKAESAGAPHLKPGDCVYAYDGDNMILLWDGTVEQ